MPDSAPVKLTVTPLAIEQLKGILAQQTKPMDVRLYVVAGIYPTIHMSLDTGKADDEKIEVGGLNFLVDSLSHRYLDDATVDCVLGAEGPAFKVTGPNVPEEVDSKPPVITPTQADASPSEKEASVRKALKKVFDPEIPMNIVDLGLIYGMSWTPEGKLSIQMTMTSPGCPVAEILVEEVRRIADEVLGGDMAVVDVVWDPPWGPDKMSEFAKRQFGYA